MHRTIARAKGSLISRQSISDIIVGDAVYVSRRFNRKDVSSFGDLVGDSNAIHDREKKTIVQGHLCSSLFGALLGSYFPGCLYMSQTVKYRRSVFVDTEIVARVEVKRVLPRSDRSTILKCETTCDVVNEDGSRVTAIDGDAMVLIPHTALSAS